MTTNEDKAIELFPDVPNMECLCLGVREKLVEMAEWKDAQIREIIDKEIDRANKYFDEHKSKEQMSASVRVVYLLCEFLGEKFPEERFHFGFATMD